MNILYFSGCNILLFFCLTNINVTGNAPPDKLKWKNEYF